MGGPRDLTPHRATGGAHVSHGLVQDACLCMHGDISISAQSWSCLGLGTWEENTIGGHVF